jgi:hypothetical protein
VNLELDGKKALVDHPEKSVRDFAEETLREIDVFQSSEDSYGLRISARRLMNWLERCVRESDGLTNGGSPKRGG